MNVTVTVCMFQFINTVGGTLNTKPAEKPNDVIVLPKQSDVLEIHCAERVSGADLQFIADSKENRTYTS